MPLSTRSRPRVGADAAARPDGLTPPSRYSFGRLTAGGTEGNERLTVWTGLLLMLLLAALGVTIVRIGQLLWLHLFLGLLLLGPVALKLLSTGYRFVRFYTSDPAYRGKGPPAPGLRALGPLVVGFTLTVFGTGVALLVLGPSSRQPLVLWHKLSFFGWVAVTALHVLGHLPEIARLARVSSATRREMTVQRAAGPGSAGRREAPVARDDVPGRGGRALSLAMALAAGLVLAVVLVPQFAVWTH